MYGQGVPKVHFLSSDSINAVTPCHWAHKRTSLKGDVIASLIIVIINILGGLAIGVGQRNMEVVGALKRYGLLTIGDGLVTQIPALVMATAAGVLVTRVASEEAETPLGAELASQIFGQPQALRVGSFFVLGLAVIPGLPGATVSGDRQLDVRGFAGALEELAR